MTQVDNRGSLRPVQPGDNISIVVAAEGEGRIYVRWRKYRLGPYRKIVGDLLIDPHEWIVFVEEDGPDALYVHYGLDVYGKFEQVDVSTLSSLNWRPIFAARQNGQWQKFWGRNKITEMPLSGR